MIDTETWIETRAQAIARLHKHIESTLADLLPQDAPFFGRQVDNSNLVLMH